MPESARILIVEDNVDVAEMLQEILVGNGYDVSLAHDGLTAFEMIQASQPDCVLLDVGLPGMDGAELSRRIRERHGDDVILIAISGHRQTDLRVATTFARVDHYLQKPIDIDLLNKVLPPVT